VTKWARWRAAWVMDLVAVLVFVGIGRAVHTDGLTVAGLASTAWPFLSGLVAGWLVVVVRRNDVTSLGGGVPVWISTVALGMVLRVVAGQGTAVAFVVVALGFLGATMLGWRALLAGARRLRPSWARVPGGRTSVAPRSAPAAYPPGPD
jgi:hypothetical protein